MALPNDSIDITPGAGATIATQLISGKEYPILMDADILGHLEGSALEYLAWSGPVTSGNQKELLHIFNADAALIVKVKGLWMVYNAGTFTLTTAVAHAVELTSTNSTTGGNVISATRPDSSTTALDADITIRTGSSGGTLTAALWETYTMPVQAGADINLLAYLNQIPKLREEDPSIVLRQNQGLRVRQLTNTAVAPVFGILIHFIVE